MSKKDPHSDVLRQAREVLAIEAEGILNLRERIGREFAETVELIYGSKGRVIVTGIGKSGIVGRKIVATLNSTGTSSFFLHPVEAMHGDLGMVLRDDVILALSNSGETPELVAILAIVQGLGARIVAMTGDAGSTLGRMADLVLDVGVAREACPLGLAPTASTTAALAMGDALAVALINRRRFNPMDFRRLHPGGSLGERLSVRVGEVMIVGGKVPRAERGASMSEALEIMNRGNLGVLLVVGPRGRLEGIFTDGDLRRALAGHEDVRSMTVDRMMTRDPIVISRDRLAAEALEIMQAHEVTVLPITDPDGRLEGMIHLHDLLGKGKFRFDPAIHFNHD
ncbi:MAG: KpsF/GutQ family sugar-phosphate isomerase [Proteobacteria bacterium]|nr:KpsF/GutQ family sugar-phosphate isomerase [Pseudomonadota bacterium]